MRFIPYAAAAVIVAVLAVCYLAFPNVETKTVTKVVKTDPFAGFTKQGSSEEQITADFLARCDYFGNRDGIVEGTVSPDEKDVVLIRCAVAKAGPVG